MNSLSTTKSEIPNQILNRVETVLDLIGGGEADLGLYLECVLDSMLDIF